MSAVQHTATPSDDLQPMYAWANEKSIGKTEWARRSAIVEKTARAYSGHDDLVAIKVAAASYLRALDQWENTDKAERLVAASEIVLRATVAKAGAT